MGMTKEERKQMEELAEKMQTGFRGRVRLRERDAKQLLTMNTDAIGRACKLFAASGVMETDSLYSRMTDDAWEAYDLLVHLVYEDWDETEVMTIGRTPDVC